ncbi:MAG: ATP-binding cassette domain-containing protein [Nitrospirae bacterium]|uniref:ABC transporter ATP-binding protein n=1 Tax=Candidatus Magnetobacterium casense TaxID=1455061 RepID=UPI00058B4056|nr:oligopeptide/dipeptide ABC transporter ATP-binding protein [Candidatus Magnetobacterium casensis]MBF0337446.1 ATP-binding cassette domain-containing protein [Nitrospirota bacterium]
MELLRVSGVVKHYSSALGLFKQKSVVTAVDGVSFSVDANNVFALVGESGCGKSTVARMIVRLTEPDAGEVLFKGVDIFGLRAGALKAYRRSVQIIFQDPFASLNPRMSIFATLSEPLRIHRIVPNSQYREKVADLLHTVGLTPDVMNRYPHEFSGGQRQRICIARALTLSPELVVADEPLSSLDVSIQAQILNLMLELKQRIGLSYLFISHDLHVVQYFSDDTGVMYLGRIVEQGATEAVFTQPLHPYTQMLIDSVPQINPKDRVHRDNVIAEESSSSGCCFYPRCPRRFEPCSRKSPSLQPYSGRLVACHLYLKT